MVVTRQIKDKKDIHQLSWGLIRRKTFNHSLLCYLGLLITDSLI